MENLNIVGFPKLLFLSKQQLAQNGGAKYEGKIKELLNQGLLEEDEYAFKITEKGKCFIDNIYYFLLEDEEKRVIENQVRVLTIR